VEWGCYARNLLNKKAFRNIGGLFCLFLILRFRDFVNCFDLNFSTNLKIPKSRNLKIRKSEILTSLKNIFFYV